MQLRILGADDLRRALPLQDAVQAMKDAYRQLSAGEAAVPLRTRIEVPKAGGLTLLMPALMHESLEFALKVVSVFPENARYGLPTIHALVVAIDAETGEPLALMEGASLTAIRTGAGSGAATDLLAPADSSSLAIFGSGVQARTQLEAVCTVRKIKRARVFSLDAAGARSMVEQLAGRDPIPQDLAVAATPAEAIEQADIICAATTSPTPVFQDADLQPGTHINAIGSYTPEMQEVDPATMARALVVVDSRDAALAETGDLIIPIRDGFFGRDHIHAELGEIVAGSAPGRSEPDQITLFKSVGVAVQDAVAAGRALARATELDLGQMIEL